MGDEVGWVAVDATILEYDYVDAGHIRLGISTSFNPNSMEILDYRIGDGSADMEGAIMPEQYTGIAGPYTNPDNRNVLEAIYDGSGISVDILGRMMLALKDADEKGRMYAKLSDAIYFVFPKNESGEIDKMIIVERVYAMKNLEEEVVQKQYAPAEMIALLGKYMVMQIQKVFIVRWDSGCLAMLLPDMGKSRPLEKMDTENRWKDPVDGKEYLFSINRDGSVSGINIFVSSALNKGGTIAWTLEKTIKEEGLDAAEKQFKNLWDNRAADLEHAEGDLNDLGYKYLGNDQIDEAILIFRLNVESFPQSSNVYDSYGDALMKNGDKETAILNFQKSVELNPDNEHGKEMLEEIRIINEID
jgi:tetratricopeptide (TPR) repeat protein